MKGPIKHLILGGFILSAIALFVGIILFLKPSVGNGEQILYVRFSDIGKIGVGTRVLFAGKPVGEVATLEKIENARAQPTDELGRVYFYQLTLHVDSTVEVFNTDEVSIQTSGLMGEKSIAITPKAVPKGVTPKRITHQPIYANSVDMLQNAMLDFSDLAVTMEHTFGKVTQWINDHGDSLGTTVRAVGAAMEEVEGAIHTMQTKETFSNAGAVMENLKSTTAKIDLITTDLGSGKGTLGKVLMDENLYLQTNAILGKANTLMNDVTHYGLLFHLNKQWQRMHLQRVAALNNLNTPQSFKDYFQAEVDEINSSMTRISLLIERASSLPEKQEILDSADFRRDFADLFRKGTNMMDTLRLYNQQFNAAIGE